ncbi:MAG: potassium efflux system protein, partial [Planctomycetota bacterium]
MRPQRFMLLQIGLLLFCFGHCFAQTKVPSLEYIEAQKASLAASSELTEARKNAAKLLYDEALQKLNEAKKHIAEREAIIAEAKKAPLELKKIQGELANDQNSSLPIGSPTTPTTELEKKLADAQSTEQVAGRSLSELKKDLQKRTLRKTELPALIVDEKKRVSDLELLIQKPIPAGEFPELVSAKQTLLVVLKKEAEEKLKFLEVEQESFDVQFGLLQARALLEEKRKARAEAIGRVWQTLLDDRRKVEAEKSKVDAENARKVAEDAHPIIQEVAERNAALTSRTVEIVQNTTIINQEVERARKHLKSISDDEEDSKKRIQAVGLTDAIGVLLRQHRGRLPTKRNFAQNIAARKAATTKVLLERFELEEENASTIDIESTVKSYFAKIEETLTPTKRARIEFLLRKNLNERRKHIDDFVARSDNYVAAMVDLDTVEKQTISRSIEYAGFIDERVLWIRSTTPIWQTDFKTIGQAFGALFSLKNWSAASYDVWQGVEEQSFLAGLCVLGLLLLGVARFLIVNHVFSADLQAAKATSFVPTIQSFLASALSAIFVPIIVWTVGRWFSNAPAPAAFTTAVGNALQSTASLIFVLNFLRRLLRPGGLGESHFSWKNPSIILVRKNLHWFIPVFIPAVFTRNFFDVSLNDQWHSSAGRLALMVVLGALAVFLGRILQPSKGLLANAPPEKTDWFIRFRGLWYMIAIILPMSLLVLTALGYHYTALELLKRLDATAGVMLVLVMIQALISRSIIVGRRKIAMKQAQERRNDVADTAVGAATTSTPPTERIDVFVVDAQSRQLLKSFMVVATILGIWYVWVDVLPALEALREFELWHYDGSAAESVIGADGK